MPLRQTFAPQDDIGLPQSQPRPNDWQRANAVYPITPAIAQRAGILHGQFQAQGVSRSAPDMLIAATATAIEHPLVLATRNVRDFLGCGVQIVDPFE